MPSSDIELAEVAVGECGGIRAVHEAGVIIRVDDGNRLPGTVARDGPELDIPDPVSRRDVARLVADRKRQTADRAAESPSGQASRPPGCGWDREIPSDSGSRGA